MLKNFRPLAPSFLLLLLVLLLFVLGGFRPATARSLDLFSQIEWHPWERPYLKTGVVAPSAVRPLSPNAPDPAVQAPDPDAQAPAREQSDARPGTLYLEIGADLQPEAYFDTDRPQRAYAGTMEREEPLGRLNTFFGFVDGPRLVTQTVLRREHRADRFSELFSTNVPLPAGGNPFPFENNNVNTGYVALPGRHAELVFGRQQVHIGPAPESSLMVSSRVPYLDAARLSLSLGRLRMTSLVSTLENRASEAEKQAGIPSRLTTAVYEEASPYGFGTTTILYNVHYFEYAWERLRLGIGGQMILARPWNPLNLGDYFPVFSWHNADLAFDNLSLILDGSYAMRPGLGLYAQLGWDDINGETFGVQDSDIPTIFGGILGLAYSGEKANGRLGALGEAGYTHYLWGSYYDSLALSRAVYRQETDDGPRSMPLTSPYGPGVIWAMGELDFAWNTGLALGGGYLLRAENTEADLYTNRYEAAKRLRNAPRRFVHRFYLRSTFRPRPDIAAYVEPAAIIEAGAFRVEAQAGMALQYRYRRVVSSDREEG